MRDVYADVIQFRGNHYDFGYKQGLKIKDGAILTNRLKLWASRRKHHLLIEKNQVETQIKRYAPFVWEELVGLSDALEWTIDEALVEFGGYYLEYGRSGCSILTGDTFLVRNYDNAPQTYEGRYCLFQPTDGGYATIGPTMQITGRSDGLNEKGLTMGYNFVNRIGSDTGFICNMIGRMILEMCSNVEEAIDLLKEIPHRHSFSYILADGSGNKAIVEASSRKVMVNRTNFPICTNHFFSLTEENRYRMEESNIRLDAMKNKATPGLSKEDAFKLLNDPSQGVFSEKYGAWAGTLHTAWYEPSSLETGFALGPNRIPIIFPFKDWLSGSKFPIRKIKGAIPTSDGFVNELL
ncbi:C45 family autoproteolytic acyltransferase/hydolase [Saliterribacillus persicus]|uniref:Putative choloylglycine hydrolase n=1 Tax=Saliterribacillus persicus TaxID=930114 RepID=A0A368Y3Z4_9BACI|nr:C45 family peptidase [Saliterribacillus persicus]RCW74912.1 putative choloylglycine hydrolase [Saliterribacillus persicus]